MNAQQLIRRLEGFSDQLYREIIRLEKLEDRVGDYIDACDRIRIPHNNRHSRTPSTQESARTKLDQLKWVLSSLNEPLQEAAAIVADAQEDLALLIPDPTECRYNPPDAWT